MSSISYNYDGKNASSVPRSYKNSVFNGNKFNESFLLNDNCGIYNKDSFHDSECDHDIFDYNNRFEVQTCRLLSLADLKHENIDVQNTILCFLNRLISFGVVGFRIDASRHIAAKNLNTIVQKLDYLQPEVIFYILFFKLKYLAFWLK